MHPQTETYWGNVNPVGPRSCYDESKRFAEALTMAYHRTYGLRTNIARIFNTYGPRMKLDDGRVVPAFIDQALRGEPLTIFGDGSQTRSFCYVSDLVDGLYRLMLSDERYPVNLGNPCEMTILDFARNIRELTGSASAIVFEPLPEDDPKQRRPDIRKAAPCSAGSRAWARRRTAPDSGVLPAIHARHAAAAACRFQQGFTPTLRRNEDRSARVALAGRAVSRNSRRVSSESSDRRAIPPAIHQRLHDVYQFPAPRTAPVDHQLALAEKPTSLIWSGTSPH